MEDIQNTSKVTSLRVAQAPFDDTAGDIILRSNGESKVDFLTHTLFLVHASPIFETILSLPQSQGNPPSHDTPIVEMHERADELRLLLLFCLPASIPEPPTSLKQLYHFHCLADKYMIDGVKVWLRSCLTGFSKEMPVGVYVLARHFGWKEEAYLAAKNSRSHPLSELVAWSSPILQDTPAVFLQELLNYHKECSEFLVNSMAEGSWFWEWYYSPYVPSFEVEKGDCCNQQFQTATRRVGYIRTWWEPFLSEYRSALANVPCLETVPLPEIFSKISKGAGKCPKCGPSVLENLLEFVTMTKQTMAYQLDQTVRVPVG
ncbi:hypothetical protein QCA50_009080 [Cerrena zonata]|uniref:BTB domain-containing protein n=1 Tax=Cerrena zonata TaxID=2478898 RepID=A0AAW0G3K4_9APHY